MTIVTPSGLGGDGAPPAPESFSVLPDPGGFLDMLGSLLGHPHPAHCTPTRWQLTGRFVVQQRPLPCPWAPRGSAGACARSLDSSAPSADRARSRALAPHAPEARLRCLHRHPRVVLRAELPVTRAHLLFVFTAAAPGAPGSRVCRLPDPSLSSAGVDAAGSHPPRLLRAARSTTGAGLVGLGIPITPCSRTLRALSTPAWAARNAR